MPSSAADDVTDPHDNIEIIFEDEENLSDEFKESATLYLLNDEPEAEDDDATTYNVLCNLFGHNNETGIATKITHKARATAPRCLQKTYRYERCTRCGVEAATVISSKYIDCCA